MNEVHQGGVRVSSHGPRRSRAIPGMLLTLIATTTGCSERPTQMTKVVDVRLRDFAIDTSTNFVRAGIVSFRITNDGPETHELVLVETDLAAGDLPLEADGITVDEDSSKLREITAIEGIRLGQTRNVRMTLDPGHYVLFCNLEGHYLGPMHAAIDINRPQTIK